MNWKEQAAAARSALTSARRGQREAVLARVGGGMNPDTVRRRIAALGFIESLADSDADLAARLETASWVQIELLAKWITVDRPGALEAASAVAAGGYSVGALRRDFDVRRPKAMSPTKAQLRERIEPVVRLAISASYGNVAAMAADDRFNKLVAPTHFIYGDDLAGDEVRQGIGVLLVGPYVDTTLYKKLRSSWTTRALAVGLFYERSILAVPQDGEIDAYRDCVAEALEAIRTRAGHHATPARDVPNVRVIAITIPSGDGQLITRSSKQGDHS